MPKCKWTFNCNDLKEEFPFLQQCGNDNTYCNASFSIAHDGRSDITNHFSTIKHKTCLAAKVVSINLINFFE